MQMAAETNTKETVLTIEGERPTKASGNVQGGGNTSGTAIGDEEEGRHMTDPKKLGRKTKAEKHISVMAPTAGAEKGKANCPQTLKRY